jgi:hypothetical protein
MQYPPVADPFLVAAPDALYGTIKRTGWHRNTQVDIMSLIGKMHAVH